MVSLLIVMFKHLARFRYLLAVGDATGFHGLGFTRNECTLPGPCAGQILIAKPVDVRVLKLQL